MAKNYVYQVLDMINRDDCKEGLNADSSDFDENCEPESDSEFLNVIALQSFW